MIEDIIKRCEIEESEEWGKWAKEIPPLNFPQRWGIKIMPPFTGAIVRFRAFLGRASVSVYLDCYDKLGHFGEPYWEIYPYDGDTFRCKMNAPEELIGAIRKSLEGQIVDLAVTKS